MKNVIFLILLILSAIAVAQDEAVPFINLPPPAEPTPAVVEQEMKTAAEVVVRTIEEVSAGPTAMNCDLVLSPSDAAKVQTLPMAPACFVSGVYLGGKLRVVTPHSYTEMPVPSQRLMAIDSEGGRSYQTGNYLIRRSEEKKFQAVLNLNFTQNRKSIDPSKENSPLTPEQQNLSEAMLNRARGCMQSLKPFLKGPDGRELEVLIMTPDEVSAFPEGTPRPEAVDINVTMRPAGWRGNSQEFGSNFDCMTISHELFHHLGLVDEYFEDPESSQKPGQTGGRAAADEWSCRQITNSKSHMRNMFDSYSDTVPQTVVCPCDDSCKAAMKFGEPFKSLLVSQTISEMVSNEHMNEYCQTIPMPNDQNFTSISEIQNPENPNQHIKSENGIHSFINRRFSGNSMSTPETKVVGLNQYICDCNKDPLGHCEKIIQGIIERTKAPRPIARCLNSSKPISGPVPATDAKTGYDDASGHMIITTPGDGKSFLTPGQFNKILSGTCKGGSPGYERCAAFSNIGRMLGVQGEPEMLPDPADPTRQVSNPKFYRPNPACNVPPECGNDDYFLGGARPQ